MNREGGTMIDRVFLAALATMLPVLAGGDPGTGSPAAAAPPAAATAEPAETRFAHLRAPLFSERFASFPAATVGDEVVTLRDLTEGLAQVHEGRSADGAAKEGSDVATVLERLVTARLFVLEARDMGILEIPEVKEAIETYRATAAREIFIERHVFKDIQPDPDEVEAIYREAVREWKVRSLLFDGEADAKAFRDGLTTVRPFASAAREALAQKKATGDEDAAWLERSRMQPAVLQAVRALAAGEVSAPIRVKGGFAILQVEEVRYPDVPQAREEARKRSAGRLKGEALQKAYNALVARYAKVDTALYNRLDFQAKKPGLEALSKDRRTLVRIQGGKPITVGDLGAALQEKFFHGADRAIAEKRVNSQKRTTLDQLMFKRVFASEAERVRIAETEEYRRAVKSFVDSALFGYFVQKAVLPAVKPSEEEGKAYYEKHKADFTSSALYRLEALGFGKPASAQAALAKLKGGTDMKWLATNADGQLKDEEQELQLSGFPVTAKSLPGDLAKALAGAGTGDYRLYGNARGQTYVVHVVELIPAQVQTFDEAREEVAKKVYAEASDKAIREWAEKLRKVHAVNVYVTRIGS
jgi:hypothetical protein